MPLDQKSPLVTLKKAMESKVSLAHRDELESSKAPPQDEEIPSFNVSVDEKEVPLSQKETSENEGPLKVPSSNSMESSVTSAMSLDQNRPLVTTEKAMESKVALADRVEVESSKAPPQDEEMPYVNVSVDEKEVPLSQKETSEDEGPLKVPSSNSMESSITSVMPLDQNSPLVTTEKAVESKVNLADRDVVESSKAPPQDEETSYVNVSVDEKEVPLSQKDTSEDEEPLIIYEVPSSNSMESSITSAMPLDRKSPLVTTEKAMESKVALADCDEVESSKAPPQDKEMPYFNVSVDEKEVPLSQKETSENKGPLIIHEVPSSNSMESSITSAMPLERKSPSISSKKSMKSKVSPANRDEMESSKVPPRDEEMPSFNLSVDEKEVPLLQKESSKDERPLIIHEVPTSNSMESSITSAMPLDQKSPSVTSNKSMESKISPADHDEVESSKAPLQDEEMQSFNVSLDQKEVPLWQNKTPEDERPLIIHEVPTSNSMELSITSAMPLNRKSPSVTSKKSKESKVSPADCDEVESSKAPLQDEEMPSFNMSVDKKEIPSSQKETSENDGPLKVPSSNSMESSITSVMPLDRKSPLITSEKVMESKVALADCDEVESSKALKKLSDNNKSLQTSPLSSKTKEAIHQIPSSACMELSAISEVPLVTPKKLSDDKESLQTFGFTPKTKKTIMNEVTLSTHVNSSIPSEVTLNQKNPSGIPKKISDNKSLQTSNLSPKTKKTIHEISLSTCTESSVTSEAPFNRNSTLVTPKKFSDNKESSQTFGFTPNTKEAMHEFHSIALIESSPPLDLNSTLVTPKKLSINKESLQPFHFNKDSSIPQKVAPEVKQISPRLRVRTRKRKRHSSDSSSDEEMKKLPENALEVDRRLQETAVRNNLTQEGVKKILKKVVTNDHVLAYVALREEEEGSGTEDERREPKITRAKAKELTKHSPAQTAPWNLELTPIKHIPVKTRPEVTALMTAQDLPDESDEEYQPTNDDVLSDDDHTLESCSDVESQPRTPATPSSHPPESPQPEEKTDGPFKVPTFKPGGKKRRNSDEEPTIARRTRSKLCLSETPIEHIEQSFVPPDELPAPSVDDLWSNFLSDVLHPTLSFRTEDDDEADPEYNVAADHDEYDDDEEALEQSLANISRKELDDLYNELMCITDIPAPALVPLKQQVEEEQTPEDDSNKTFFSLQNVNTQVLGVNNIVNTFHKPPIPIKEEQTDTEDIDEEESEREQQPPALLQAYKGRVTDVTNIVLSNKGDKIVEEVVVEQVSASVKADKAKKPRILRKVQEKKELPQKVNIVLNSDSEAVIDPTQVLILEQQLRQHIQMCAATYLQINIHPLLWEYAPDFKKFLETLLEMADKQLAEGRKSVVDVCNLRPAVELVNCWHHTVNQDTPENKKMLDFLQKESEKCLRRNVQNIVYIGSFHDTLLETVANSSVFVYPYLLPPVPFRCDTYRRQNYLPAEDRYIALGLEQFYKHVDANRDVYNLRRAVTLTQVVSLVVEHMLPWARPRSISYRIQQMRRSKDPDHPIRKFFEKKKVEPVQHKLLSFNPNMTLHQQPEYEMPLTWVRYIGRLNKRASEFVMRRAQLGGYEPASVDIDVETREPLTVPLKTPLPVIQTTEANQQLGSISFSIKPLDNDSTNTDLIQPTPMTIIQTKDGGFLLPITLVPQGGTVNSTKVPIVSTKVAEKENRNIDENSNATISSVIYHDDSNEDVDMPDPLVPQSHCECCILMKKIKKRWSLITNYFTSARTPSETRNCCIGRKSLEVSRRLKYFLLDTRGSSFNAWQGLDSRVTSLEKLAKSRCDKTSKNFVNTFSEKSREDAQTTDSISEEIVKELQDQIWVTSFMNKLALTCLARNKHCKSLHQMFKFFRFDHDCPVELYNKVSRLLRDEHPDLVQEFLGLLTGEQAEQLGLYREYFVIRHLQEFTQLITREAKDSTSEQEMLHKVSSALIKCGPTACEVCCAFLDIVRCSRPLSEFVFDITPHRIKTEPQTPGQNANAQKTVNIAPLPCATTNNNNPVLVTKKKRASAANAKRRKIAKPAVDTCTSISPKKKPGGTTPPILAGIGESAEAGAVVINCQIPDAASIQISHAENSVQSANTVSECLPNLNATDPYLEVDTPELSISKTEVEESFVHSPDTIMASETQVKAEPPDWSREEDKLLLQAVKLHATPEETKQMTILEVLEEKNVISNLKKDLADKSEIHIRKRIKYLLQFLI